ncbi:MAG: nucleotidyltransferase domain-containing protein [bacterium]
MTLKMNENQRKALSQYLGILRKRYKKQISKIILFGSVARGNLDPESDIDLLVVITNGDQNLKDEINMACFDIILETDVILSPLVMDRETYEWHKKYHDPLYNNIQKDGIELWIKKPEFL